jgi:glycosyltransferase involved in cell wall biosynthesis
MKILWICNVPNSEAISIFKYKNSHIGGWLTAISKNISEYYDIELYYAFPNEKVKKTFYFFEGKIKYIVFPKTNSQKEVVNAFLEINKKIKPYLVHIFGTEYRHSFYATLVFPREKTLISIQGMPSFYKYHFFSNIPEKVSKEWTLYEILKLKNLRSQRGLFSKNGIFEHKAINNVQNVIGRTLWDKVCTSLINPEVNYYHCYETLREEFYSGSWEISKIEKFSIFIPQAYSPIKGFHNLIEAFKIIKIKYPLSKIYVSGANILKPPTLFGFKLENSYFRYIKRLINKLGLTNDIIFLGNLSPKSMKERLLKSHVFVLPSSIENSPNSLGEAMILGVPTIASFVGGIPSLMTHEKEGFMSQHDAPYMISHFIDTLFSNNELAMEFSENSKKRAKVIYDQKANSAKLYSIYKEMILK